MATHVDDMLGLRETGTAEPSKSAATKWKSISGNKHTNQINALVFFYLPIAVSEVGCSSSEMSRSRDADCSITHTSAESPSNARTLVRLNTTEPPVKLLTTLSAYGIPKEYVGVTSIKCFPCQLLLLTGAVYYMHCPGAVRS